MDSALSPREIQARIRSGETLEAVAEEAGCPAEKIEPFAAPVLAERAHLVGVAQSSPVRRMGEPASSHQALRHMVEQRLEQRGIDPDTAIWDAWQRQKPKWTVQVVFVTGDDEAHDLRFVYDQSGRFSLPDNDEAKELIGDPQRQNRQRRDPDHEPTLDYTDEFALVRAVGVDGEPVASDGSETVIAEIDQVTTIAVVGDDMDLGSDQLTQVDGVYDIVPDTGGLDMIYDLLGTYGEEGAPYAFEDAAPGDVPASEPDATPEPTPDKQPSRRERRRKRQQADAAEAEATTPVPVEERTARDAREAGIDDEHAAEAIASETTVAVQSETSGSKPARPDPDARDAADPVTTEQTQAAAEAAEQAGPAATHSDHAEPPQARTARDARESSEPTEPEQHALIETDEPIPSPKPGGKKKRAAVPSWDEIMFGGPRPGKK